MGSTEKISMCKARLPTSKYRNNWPNRKDLLTKPSFNWHFADVTNIIFKWKYGQSIAEPMYQIHAPLLTLLCRDSGIGWPVVLCPWGNCRRHYRGDITRKKTEPDGWPGPPTSQFGRVGIRADMCSGRSNLNMQRRLTPELLFLLMPQESYVSKFIFSLTQ